MLPIRESVYNPDRSKVQGGRDGKCRRDGRMSDRGGMLRDEQEARTAVAAAAAQDRLSCGVESPPGNHVHDNSS